MAFPIRSKIGNQFWVRTRPTDCQPNLEAVVGLTPANHIYAEGLDDAKHSGSNFQQLTNFRAGSSSLADQPQKTLPVPGYRQIVPIRKAAKMLKSRLDVVLRNH